MSTTVIPDLLLVGGMGVLGAVANCILVEGGFAIPRKVAKDSNRVVIDLGFLGTILLGAVAAVATYLLGTSTLSAARQLGIAVIAGVGGGNVLTSLAQKQEAQILKAQMDALDAALREALKTK